MKEKILCYLLALLIPAHALAQNQLSLIEENSSRSGEIIPSGAQSFNIENIRLGNQTKRTSLFNVKSGHVQITVRLSDSETQTLNIWFDDRHQARMLVELLENHPNIRLGYDFANSTFYTHLDQYDCRFTRHVAHCQSSERDIASRNIDGNNLRIIERDTLSEIALDSDDLNTLGISVEQNSRFYEFTSRIFNRTREVLNPWSNPARER